MYINGIYVGGEYLGEPIGLQGISDSVNFNISNNNMNNSSYNDNTTSYNANGTIGCTGPTGNNYTKDFKYKYLKLQYIRKQKYIKLTKYNILF